MPHYGFLTMGGVMAGLGFPLLAIALLTPAHQVFVWIGMGLALAGSGCWSLALAGSSRLPAGTRANYSVLILGGSISLIGLLMLTLLVARNGFWSVHPSNVFIWIGGA